MKHLLFLLFLALPTSSHAQETVNLRICTYNVLNLGDNDYDRAEAFRTVLGGIRPDLLVCQEVNKEIGLQMLLDSALTFGLEESYRTTPFNDGPDTDNGLLYNPAKVELIEAHYHPTALRDVAEYIVLPVGTEDTLVIFSLHLKAGDDSESEAQRVEEAKIVRVLIEAVPSTRSFIVAGDLNVYSAAEIAYQWLTDPLLGAESTSVIDPINREGAWHDKIEFADVATQSTRGRQFGGGLQGGMDDRFDFILLSGPTMQAYQTGSYTAYGNDGNHFDDSINAGKNSVVPQNIAQALHDASDHLPVFLDLQFVPVVTSVLEERSYVELPMGIW